MRKIMVASLLLALASPLFAADPFTGTWKLNSEKTKYTTGTAAKELTAVIEEKDANLQVTATGMTAESAPISVKYTIPIAGGAGTVQEGDFDGISSKLTGKVRVNSYIKSGKLLRTRRMVVSADGKTMKTAVKGTSLGKQIKGVDFFDKQ